MTSSLVGSEMCIRDSISSACVNGNPEKRWQDGAPPIARGQALPPDGPQSVCLLYTSDAADDM
eukprot:531754-Prorocentrum_lima.AAC.1